MQNLQNLILSADESAVMSAIADSGAVPLFELASRAKIAPSRVARAVEKLTEYRMIGTVEQLPSSAHPEMRSAIVVQLTEEGAAVLRRFRRWRLPRLPTTGQFPMGTDLKKELIQQLLAHDDNYMTKEDIERWLDDEVKKLAP